MTEVVWPCVEEGKGGYRQEDAGEENEKKGRPGEMWMDNTREDMKEYKMTKKCRHIHNFTEDMNGTRCQKSWQNIEVCCT